MAEIWCMTFESRESTELYRSTRSGAPSAIWTSSDLLTLLDSPTAIMLDEQFWKKKIIGNNVYFINRSTNYANLPY